MSNKEAIINFLINKKKKRYCDDCLSKILEIYPRQQVNQISRNLAGKGHVNRERGLCFNCSKYKIVNSCGSNVVSLDEIPPSQEPLTERIVHGKRLNHKDFECRVANYVGNKFGKRFFSQSLQVGSNKCHNFDLVSEDKNIVVECKSYTWTESGNFPSAKISMSVEAIFYFSRIVADKKILVFQDDINDRGESLVDIFVRRYDEVLDDIEVWAYKAGDSIERDNVRVVRKPKDNWYEKLYGG